MKTSHQILLVDRDPNDERIVRDVLRSAGFGIHVSTDGPSAIQAFNTIHPDLVLIDTEVADADGGAMGREMKESPAGHATPLVLMSAEKLGPSRQAQALKASGCATVLRKPLTPQDLLETLTRLLPNAFIPGPPAEAEPSPATGSAGGTRTKSPKSSISARSRKTGKQESPFSADSFDEQTLGTLFDQIFPGTDSGDVAGAIAKQAHRAVELHDGTGLPAHEAATGSNPLEPAHPPIEPLNDEDSMDVRLDEAFSKFDDSMADRADDSSVAREPDAVSGAAPPPTPALGPARSGEAPETTAHAREGVRSLSSVEPSPAPSHASELEVGESPRDGSDLKPDPSSHTPPAPSMESSALDEFPLMTAKAAAGAGAGSSSPEARKELEQPSTPGRKEPLSKVSSKESSRGKKRHRRSGGGAVPIPVAPAATAQAAASTLKSVSVAESLAELSAIRSPASETGSSRVYPGEELGRARRHGLSIRLLVAVAAASAALAALVFFLMRPGESDLRPARGGAASSIPASATSEQTEASTETETPTVLAGGDGASAGEVSEAGGVPTTDGVSAAGGIPAAGDVQADAGPVAPFSPPAASSRRDTGGSPAAMPSTGVQSKGPALTPPGPAGRIPSRSAATGDLPRSRAVNADPSLQKTPAKPSPQKASAFSEPNSTAPPAHPSDAGLQDASTDAVSRDVDKGSSAVQSTSERAAAGPISASEVEVSPGPENATLAVPSESVPAPSAGASAEEGGPLTSPMPLRRTAPAYPRIALTMKLAGAVKLLVKVEVDGRVGDVRVTRSATPLLDQAARSAAYSWTYRPARRGRSPVATWIEETVEFTLK